MIDSLTAGRRLYGKPQTRTSKNGQRLHDRQVRTNEARVA